MIKIKEIAGPSCPTNAKDDEPLFVLRANDELAPALVLRWAYLYARLKGDAITEKQKYKLAEAIGCASAMLQWKRDNSEPKSSFDAIVPTRVLDVSGVCDIASGLVAVDGMRITETIDGLNKFLTEQVPDDSPHREVLVSALRMLSIFCDEATGNPAVAFPVYR